MKSFFVCTLGCRLNEAESASIAADFEARGYQRRDSFEDAGVVVINTCTVTNRTDQESRRLIRRARALSPDATVVVTGCYAQTEAERLKQMEGVDRVIPNAQKFFIAEILEEEAAPETLLWDDAVPRTRSRANVKVQEGCDEHCTYCRVVLARGASQSRPAGGVIGHIKKLAAAGFEECVLTGVQLGQYQDAANASSLSALIKKILMETELRRLRLSSINPQDLTDELIQVIAESEGRAANFLHVAVQSGSDAVLKRMGRNYSAALARERIARAADLIPRLGLGTDLIVGFPGETEEDFELTRRLVEDLPFTNLHVFRYSPRPGTAAARLNDGVSSREKRRRSEVLRMIGEEKHREFCRSLLGSVLRVFVEPRRDAETNLLLGLSGNYIQVLVEGADGHEEQIIPVEAHSLTEAGLRGRRVTSGEPA